MRILQVQDEPDPQARWIEALETIADRQTLAIEDFLTTGTDRTLLALCDDTVSR